MTHPVLTAWAAGAHPAIAQTEIRYFATVVTAITEITANLHDRTKLILWDTGELLHVYRYDGANVDAEDGLNIVHDTEDNPFVRVATFGAGATGELFNAYGDLSNSDRDAYDAEAAGFTFYDTDGEEWYVRVSATPGTWAGPLPFAGPAGTPGAAVVTATSTTSLAIGTGTKVFTLAEATARGFALGTRLRAASAASPNVNWMEGPVTAYSHPSITLDVELTSGAGTLDDWSIGLSGEQGPAGGGLANIVEDVTPQLGGVLDTNSFAVQWSKGADVASPGGGALTLGNDGNYFDITGTNAITSIGTKKVGMVAKLHFDAALTLTHHSTDLVLPGAANITTAAGDEAEFVEYATGDWRCTKYTRASGKPVVPSTPTEAGALGQGKHTIQLWPGSFMDPASNGPEYLKVSATNQLPAWGFDASADESVWFAFRAPKSAAETTITFDLVWSHPATDTNFGVAFFLELVAVGNDELISASMGTAVGVTDTGGTTNDIYTSAESAAVTPGNTWAEGDLVIGRLYRDVSDAGDTLAVDARVHLMNLYLTINAPTDA